MPKSSLEKTIEKAQAESKMLEKKRKQEQQKADRVAKQMAKKEHLRHQAATIISSQPIINGMRIMDETAEIILQCLLDCELGTGNRVNFSDEIFPEYAHLSLSLEFEKLVQYGMIGGLIAFDNGGFLNLMPPAFTYFERKEAAMSSKIAERNEEQVMINSNNKVFIVHGHDNGAKIEMARVLEKAGLEPIILHEQADAGRTIIEKIEYYSDVAFAVVLYTQCDFGRAKSQPVENEQYRARQNVVFEHGYLIGKLGRDRVCAIVKDVVETPGDISGVVYTPMDTAGAWKTQLFRNMKVVGLDIDLNKALA